MSFEIFNPEELGRPSGWSNGLLAPAGARILFVAGQTAAEAGPAAEGAPDTGAEPADGDLEYRVERFVAQFRAALERVLVVVREAGGMPTHVGRLTIFVADMEAYLASRKPLGEAYRELMGSHYPAMALVEAKRLVDPAAVVEIEATAAIPADAPPDGSTPPDAREGA